MTTLRGRTAIVTGAGRGIGRGIALALAKEGANIVVAERDPATAGSTAREIGEAALAVTCDVSQRDQVDATVAATIERFGTVDVLVNNAQHVFPLVPLEDHTDKQIDLTLRTGFHGSFYFMQACFPHMRERGYGRIVNLGSGAGYAGQPLWAAYAATKEAIRGLSKVAAHEWARHGITVNVICPFAASTGYQMAAEADPEMAAGWVRANPMRRVGDCEQDIGRVVVFLAGPDSGYMTGQTIHVDGGQVHVP